MNNICRYCKHWTQTYSLNIYHNGMGICSADMVPEVRHKDSKCAMHEPIMCTHCGKHHAYVRDVCVYCDDYLEGLKRDAREEQRDDVEDDDDND